MRESPDHLATRYGLLIGSANALLTMTPLAVAGRAATMLETLLSLASWIVLVGSLFLLLRLGYLSGRHNSTIGMAVGPGIKAGLLAGLVTYIGVVVYLLGSGLFPLLGRAFGSSGPATVVLGLILIAFSLFIVSSLVGAGLATLGATVARSRIRT